MPQVLSKYLFVFLWTAMALSWLGAGIFSYFFCASPFLMAWDAFMMVIASINSYVAYKKVTDNAQ